MEGRFQSVDKVFINFDFQKKAVEPSSLKIYIFLYKTNRLFLVILDYHPPSLDKYITDLVNILLAYLFIYYSQNLLQNRLTWSSSVWMIRAYNRYETIFGLLNKQIRPIFAIIVY